MAGKLCPACGRAVVVRHEPRCLYCGTHLPADPVEIKPVADPVLERVRACFALLARCKTSGDLAPVLPWLSPVVAETLQDEIDQNRRSRVKHVIDRVTVGGVTMAPDAAAARIDAVYAEYWQDERTHMIVRGLRGAKPHRETWRLAPAPATDPPLRDRCAGCGADLGARIDLKCPFCGLVPPINRLGFIVISMDREDPAAIYEEWKARLGEHGTKLTDRHVTMDDPIRFFIDTLRGIFRE